MNKNKGLNIIVWTLLIGVIVALGTFFFIKDEYTAESTIEIESSENQNRLLSVLTSEELLEKTIEENQLPLSSDAFKKALEVVNSDNHMRYKIKLSYNNKQDAIDLTDIYTKTIEEEIGNIVPVDDVQIIDFAKDKEVKNRAILPRLLYIGIGLLIGALLGLLSNAIQHSKDKKYDDKKRQDAIAKYPVLGTIRIY